MVSDGPHDDDHSAEKPSAILISVQVEHIDQLVQIARDLAGFILILDAAAIGDPALGAVERILSQINDQLQEFKSWFHNAWRQATADAVDSPNKE